jgi:hypothetical protein
MKKLLISALVILPISSWAAWEITSIEPDQAIYHDKETKQKDKSLVKMWTMTDFPETREAEFGSFQSFKSLDVFDCSKKRHAFSNAVFFSDKLASGDIVHTITKDTNRLEWRTIKNQGASEIEWKIACEQ